MQVAIDCGSMLYYIVPWSMSSAVLNLAKASNVGLTGRWMFRAGAATVSPAHVTVEPGYGYIIVNPTHKSHAMVSQQLS
jgi:hypothetical protein